jgi:CheY-like chemotaxis protein
MDETPTFVDDVEVVGDDGVGLLHCLRKGRHFHVPRYNLLHGSAGVQVGVTGLTLVLPRWFVRNLGLEDDEKRATLEAPPSHRMNRILVVDDDDDSREALCALLECWGHRVVAATTGQQALGFAVEMRLDSVVFSFSLPDMGGRDFARTLRSLRLAPAPELIAYSSRAHGPDDAPVDTFIQKPDVRALERLFHPAHREHGVPKLPLPGKRSR